jgi:hypothetical protein
MFEDALKTTGNEGRFVVREIIELVREAMPLPAPSTAVDASLAAAVRPGAAS